VPPVLRVARRERLQHDAAYRDVVLKTLATLSAGLTRTGFAEMREIQPVRSARATRSVASWMASMIANKHRPELFAPRYAYDPPLCVCILPNAR
jgi:hypothetical protein